MPPSVQNNSRDIAPSVEARSGKHGCELLADALFIVAKRGAQHFGTALMSLLFGRQSRVRVKNFYGQHHGRIGADTRIVATDDSLPAHIRIVADALEPAAPGNAHFM